DVLGDSAVRQEVELLMDDADAGTLGVARMMEVDLLAEQRDGADVRLVGASEDLHERRLTRAVLARQRMYLAAAALEVDRIECREVAEALGDALHLQGLFVRRRWGCSARLRRR